MIFWIIGNGIFYWMIYLISLIELISGMLIRRKKLKFHSYGAANVLSTNRIEKFVLFIKFNLKISLFALFRTVSHSKSFLKCLIKLLQHYSIIHELENRYYYHHPLHKLNFLSVRSTFSNWILQPMYTNRNTVKSRIEKKPESFN